MYRRPSRIGIRALPAYPHSNKFPKRMVILSLLPRTTWPSPSACPCGVLLCSQKQEHHRSFPSSKMPRGPFDMELGGTSEWEVLGNWSLRSSPPPPVTVHEDGTISEAETEEQDDGPTCRQYQLPPPGSNSAAPSPPSSNYGAMSTLEATHTSGAIRFERLDDARMWSEAVRVEHESNELAPDQQSLGFPSSTRED